MFNIYYIYIIINIKSKYIYMIEIASENTAIDETKYLKANNFVCTTAIKAYGRLFLYKPAMAVLYWYEQKYNEVADIYFMSALLYVCAKAKRVKEAGRYYI